MIKILIWALLLVGFAIPLMLSLISISISRQTDNLTQRHGKELGFGAGATYHDSYAYVEMFGYKFSVNPRLYPAIIVLCGIALVVIGMICMLYIDVHPASRSIRSEWVT